MLADIAVLDRDVTMKPATEIGEFKVTATIVGGRIVYEG
jgi:predicted amidohydrolase YtcJ